MFLHTTIVIRCDGDLSPFQFISLGFINLSFKICRVKFLNAAENLVDFQYYLPHTVKGDVVNTTNQAERDIASNYKAAVSSYGE